MIVRDYIHRLLNGGKVEVRTWKIVVMGLEMMRGNHFNVSTSFLDLYSTL